MTDIIIAVVITIVVTAIIVWFAASTYYKKCVEVKVGSAQARNHR